MAMNKEMTALLTAWEGPFGGVPPWDKIVPSALVDAMRNAIEQAESEIELIANESEVPDFENTIVALELAGQTLDRLTSIFWVHAANLNLDPMPEIQKQVMPMLAAHRDRVSLNGDLFGRVQHVCEGEEMEHWSKSQRRLVKKHFRELIRSGAKLSSEAKSQLTVINQRLAVLYADFSQHVLNDEQDVTWIENEAELKGIPSKLIKAMKQAADELGSEQPWAVLNTRSMADPILTFADCRALRENVWNKFCSRGDQGNENDNNRIVAEIVRLRADRAALLGYASHAAWAMEQSMAKSPSTAMDLMMGIWPKAVARVHQEVADMQALADELGHGIEIEAWDYRYYAEKVRQAKYDLDFNEITKYLQLDKLVEAMFWCSQKLFGLTFRRTDSIPTFHPEVAVWEVKDASDRPLGVFYLDAYAREGKRSGAWMTSYRRQYCIDEPVLPLISNNSNFIKESSSAPTLISWDDAETLFHEFGHALHGLLSNVQYPSQSGTSVARDYVEFPSQIFEHWLSAPEVLSKFCVHHETGDPIPQVLVTKIRRAATFNQGFSTVEFLASAILDMKLHMVSEIQGDLDPRCFERDTLAELGMPKEVVMRHRLPHFLHLFSDYSYAAGYYSYLWADVLTADAAEAFEACGSFFDQETARRLHEHVLSVGDSIDPEESYRAFRGRDVETDALLRKRGFPVER